MVAIKDMKMPKNCGECDCSYWHDYCGTYFCSLTGNNVLENQKDMDCPIVETEERKIGKWITNPNKMKGTEIECNKCGVSALSKIGIQVCSDFCPNCGAEMRLNNYDS